MTQSFSFSSLSGTRRRRRRHRLRPLPSPDLSVLSMSQYNYLSLIVLSIHENNLSLSLSLSLSHTHTHTHTLSLSLSLSLSLTHTHTHTLKNTHTLTLTHSLTHSLIHSFTHSLSHTHQRTSDPISSESILERPIPLRLNGANYAYTFAKSVPLYIWYTTPLLGVLLRICAYAHFLQPPSKFRIRLDFFIRIIHLWASSCNDMTYTCVRKRKTDRQTDRKIRRSTHTRSQSLWACASEIFLRK